MKVDTIIVGAGTAGLSALREVRRHTEDFLLVNDGHWGTTLVGALMLEQNDEWAVSRRHMPVEKLTDVCDHTEAAPMIAAQ